MCEDILHVGVVLSNTQIVCIALGQLFSAGAPQNPWAPPALSSSSARSNTNSTMPVHLNSPLQIFEQGFLEPLEYILGVLFHHKVERGCFRTSAVYKGVAPGKDSEATILSLEHAIIHLEDYFLFSWSYGSS